MDDSIAGVITRDWDGLDRLIEEDTPEGLVSYTYDDAGRRTTMTVDWADGCVVHIRRCGSIDGMTQGTADVGLAYDNANRRTRLTLPNGIEVAYTYDDAHRVSGITYSLERRRSAR